MNTILIQTGVLLVLLFCSAYFSGTETGIFSLSRLEREELLRSRGGRRRKILAAILGDEHAFLVTILTGNMLVNVFSSSLGEALGSHIFPASSDLFVIIIMTLALLVFGEMTPKNLAVRHPVRFTQRTSLPLFYIHKALSPIRLTLEKLSSGFMKLLRIRENGSNEHSLSVVLSALRLGHRKGIFDDSEVKIVESYFRFRDRSAGDVMIPRNRLFGVSCDNTIEELYRIIRTGQHSRPSFIIIYEETIDHIIGYVKLRDLAYALKGDVAIENLRIKPFIHPLFTVPESKTAVDLLEEMKQNNAEIALLIDEYGGTAGLVTFDTLVESLLGYFYPSDGEEPEKVSEGVYRVPGSCPVDELRDLLELTIETGSRTVGGLILEELGEIPRPGQRVTLGELDIEVRRMEGGRVLEAQIVRRDAE